jgi:hypothetical protein
VKRTLTLTSPFTTGEDVEYAQRLLQNGPGSAQAFGTRFYDGVIDGVFGPESGSACHEAKWELGYEADNCAKTFGTDLERLLTGAAERSVEQERRAVSRGFGNVESSALGARAVDWLAPHLGMAEEPPGSNRNAFTAWYGHGPEPWCAVTITRALVAAGSGAWQRGGFEDFVPNIVRAAQSGDRGLHVIRFRDVVKGDLVAFDWQKGSGVDANAFDHAGFVLEPTSGSTWRGREGNHLNRLVDTTRSLAEATCLFIRATL